MKDTELDRSDHQKVQAAMCGRYLLDGIIGHGGTATVYRARDLKHDRLVAVKVLNPQLVTAVGVERFRREIAITARLQHPHILPLLDSDSTGGVLYFVMPYVEGPTLHQRLRRGTLPLEDALRLGQEVANALSYAHRQDIVHLDIKPGNVLLSNGHAIVADFGIARAVCKSCTDDAIRPGVLIGTPEYMSPEQAAGYELLDGRSDVYSLACVLYEMLAGRPPFGGDSVETVIYQQLGAEPLPVSDVEPHVPEAVERVLSRSLIKDRQKRLASAADLAAALQQARDELSRVRATGGDGSRSVAGFAALSLSLLALLAALTLAVAAADQPGTDDASNVPATPATHFAPVDFRPQSSRARC